MTYAYLRQIPGFENLSQQQRNILSFALTRGIQIDKEVIEYNTKQRAIEEREEFESFLHSLQENEDRIVVDHLAILSDNAEELIKIINCMLSRGITLFVAETGVTIERTTPLAKVFPLLNDLREAKRANTGRVGRPKGSRSSSKFDIYQTRIIAMLKEGMSVSAIARELGVSRSSLKDYIESRGIRELVESSWVQIADAQQIGQSGDAMLICPFDRQETAKTEYKQERKVQ